MCILFVTGMKKNVVLHTWGRRRLDDDVDMFLERLLIEVILDIPCRVQFPMITWVEVLEGLLVLGGDVNLPERKILDGYIIKVR